MSTLVELYGDGKTIEGFPCAVWDLNGRSLRGLTVHQQHITKEAPDRRHGRFVQGHRVGMRAALFVLRLTASGGGLLLPSQFLCVLFISDTVPAETQWAAASTLWLRAAAGLAAMPHRQRPAVAFYMDTAIWDMKCYLMRAIAGCSLASAKLACAGTDSLKSIDSCRDLTYTSNTD